MPSPLTRRTASAALCAVLALGSLALTAPLAANAENLSSGTLLSGDIGVRAAVEDLTPFRTGHILDIVGVQSGKSLTSSSTTATSPGVRIRSFVPEHRDRQLWTVHEVSGGAVGAIVLVDRTGRVLTGAAAGTSMSAATLDEALADPSMQWVPVPAADGSYSLQSVSQSQVLDVSGGSTAEGADVVLWTGSGASNQRWTVRDLTVIGHQPTVVQTATGVTPELPATVAPRYASMTGPAVPVSWDTAGADWSTPGSVSVSGSATDAFGTAFTVSATVEVGEISATDPTSVTTATGNSLAAVVATAPATVRGQVGTSENRFDAAVTWDFSGLSDSSFATPDVIAIPGATSVGAVPAILHIIVAPAHLENVAPASVPAATYTESGWPVSRTTNLVLNDKGWSNWRSGTKNAQDTLTYTLAGSATVDHALIRFYKDGGASWATSIVPEYRQPGSNEWISGAPIAVTAPADGAAPIVEVSLGRVRADAVRFVLTAAPAMHMVVSEVEIHRAVPSASSIAGLARVTIAGRDLEGFESDTTDYEIETDSPTLDHLAAVATDNAATVTVTQSSVEEPSATVLVRAADGTERTYTFSPVPATALQVTAVAGTRCVAGKVLISVQASNSDVVPASIATQSVFGSKSFSAVAPGKNAVHAFTTRAATIGAGTVTVEATATVGGEEVILTLEAPYAARTCG